MPSKARTETDTRFDRRTAEKRSTAPSRRKSDREVKVEPERPRGKRATRDGRQPLVVYMRPETIKALKIAALENDTTASAIVADAVSSWLRSRRG